MSELENRHTVANPVCMIFSILRDPSLRLNQAIQNRKDLAGRYQSIFYKIQRTQVSIFNSTILVANVKERSLQPVLASLDQLVETAYQLCKRFTPLENFRQVSTSAGDQQVDLEIIEAQINAASDPTVRKDYEDSARSIQERLIKGKELDGQLNRLDSLLTSLVNDLDGIQTEIISIQPMDVKRIRMKTPELIQKIQQETQQL